MRALQPLLRPRSIAMVGASSDPTRGNGRTLRYLLQGGFTGALFAVNPRRSEVQGLRSYPSIRDLPQSVDCVIVALPAVEVAGALRDCAAAGAGSAIVFAGGFAETGSQGRQAQDELTRIARTAAMPVLGPNSLGAYDARSRSFMTFSSMFEDGFETGGRIGMVTQSGGWGSQARRLAAERGLSLVQWVSTGNECDVTAGEVLQAMAEDPDIDVILLYLEGIRGGDDLRRGLAAACARRKPVVAIKVGRTQAGQAAAASHTASMTGEDGVFDALCLRHGVHRADSIEELLDVAYAALHAIGQRRMPAGPRSVILSPSGGFAVHMTDQAIRQGLSLPAPPPQSQARILELAPHAAVSNPVDVTGQVLNQIGDFGQTLDLLLADDTYDAADVFVGMAGAAPALREQWLHTLQEAAQRRPGKWLGISILANADTRQRYESAGFAVFEDTSRMVTAHAALVRMQAAFDRPQVSTQAPLVVVLPPAGPLSEAAASDVLRQAGISRPAERLCTNGPDAAQAARELGGRLAVKVVSPDIAHKTEVGGVVLDLDDAQSVLQAVHRIEESVRARQPEARIEGYLVSAMAGNGVDVLVGLRHDPALGPVLVVGAGGIHAEWLNDICIRMAPVSLDEAHDMLAQTRVSRLLAGWRGAPAADIEALAHALVAISRLRSADGLPFDLEINPLRVLPSGQGVLALDALITRAPA